MILCYEVALDWLWHQGRVSKFLELACPWTHKEEKTIPVWFFHCLQFHAISFSSSARIRVRQEMSHRVNNVKQRTTLCWRASLYKKKARASVRYRIEACYHNDQAETRKIRNAYKVFSFWACVLSAWCSLFKWCGFNLAVYFEFQWRYSLAPPEFIKLSRRRRVYIYSPYLAYPISLSVTVSFHIRSILSNHDCDGM